MKKMKKVLSLVLVLIMVLSLFPVAAFAEFNGMLGSIWEPGEDIEPLPLPTTLPEVEEPEEEEAVLFDSVEQTFYVEDENGVAVDVEAPAGALPMGADLVVSSVAPETIQADVDALLGAETNVLLAMDISFVDENGNEVHPAADVKVMLSGGALADKENLQVVHFPDETLAPELVTQLDASDVAFEYGTDVAFRSKDFSVYAVVDGSTDDNARLAVNFLDGTTNIATVYVKNADLVDSDGITAEQKLEQIVYDPSVGSLGASKVFYGWTTDPNYTKDTTFMTVEQLRTYIKTTYSATPITEGAELNLYAGILTVYNVVFYDAYSVVIASESILFNGNDGAQQTYTINLDYTPEDTEHVNFQGWNVVAHSDKIVSAKDSEGQDVSTPYPNGTVLTITGSVTLGVNEAHGNWLSFRENGAGASYTPPQFLQEDETGYKPEDPVRNGYTFDNWYKLIDWEEQPDPNDPSKTIKVPVLEATPYGFDTTITKRVTLYAKWTPNPTARYTVIIWKERMSDTYAANVTAQNAERNYDFATSFSFENGVTGETISNVQRSTSSSVVDGDTAGTRYYNAVVNGTLLDKNYDVPGGAENIFLGYHCARIDENVKIAPEGTSVLNVYYDRNTVQYTFYYPYDYTYTPATYGRYGLVDGEYVQLYYRGMFGGYNEVVDNDSHTTVYYSSGWYDYTRYTGTRYNRSSSQSWQTYRNEIGLYGETLNWPTDTSIWWHESSSTDYWGNPNSTRMTYKSAFLPLDDDMTVEYWGFAQSATGGVYFYTQNVTGNGYTQRYNVSTDGGSFSINDKFTGFVASQYRVDNGQWQNVGELDVETGIYGSAVSYNSRLDIRYDRIKGNITFLDGGYYNGNNVLLKQYNKQGNPFKTSEDYFYEASVADYNKGGSEYYEPTAPYSGFAFAGWYADDACTHIYNFTTMPAGGVTVYAKWVYIQYRVFMHPNVPVTDSSLEWGDGDNQSLSFRIDYGGEISPVLGEREGFELAGWYMDDGTFKNQYVFDATVLNDQFGYYGDYTAKTEGTELDKYGQVKEFNADETPLNKDKANNRTWITQKVDLYAKWRETLPGARGINVVYDAVDGKGTIPYNNDEVTYKDPMTYLDNTTAAGAPASVASSSEEQFMYWVLQKYTSSGFVDATDANGQIIKVYPGGDYTVLKANAQRTNGWELEDGTIQQTDSSGNQLYTYTVKLRAEYGPASAPNPTHITWYGNGGTLVDPVDPVENQYGAIGTVGQTTTSYVDLQINEAVPVAPFATFARSGYKFIGWARDTEPADAYSSTTAEDGTVTHTVDETKYTEKTDVTLWLKLNDDGVTFSELDASGNVIAGHDKITEVAADEFGDYHALYAVWQAQYYVYYTGSGKLYSYDVGTKLDLKLTNGKTEGGFLYGGYSTTYWGGYKPTADDMKSASALLEGGYQMTGTNVKYNPDKKFVSGVKRWWRSMDDVDAATVAPAANAVIYVKEVPTKYLTSRIQYVYDFEQGNKLNDIFFLTVLDDGLYASAWFEVDLQATIAGSFTFVTENTDLQVTSQPTDFEGVAIGQIGFAKADDTMNWNDEFIPANTQFTVTPYWITLDGVKVYGISRTFTTGAAGTSDTLAEVTNP